MLNRAVAPIGVCLGLGLWAMALHPPVEAQQESRNGLITGRVLDAASGQPVAGAFVLIGVPGGGLPEPPLPEPVVTDDRGRFFFARLPAGAVSLRARKSGWMEGAYGRGRPGGASRDLALGQDERRGDIVLSMWRYATISGRVVDEAGEPLVGFEVHALGTTWPAGRPRLDLVGRTHTDDRGVYRMSDLPPGSYYVMLPAAVTTEPANFSQVSRAAGEIPRTYLQSMTSVGTAPRVLTSRAEVVSNDTDWTLKSVIALPSTPPADGPWHTFPTTFYPGASTIDDATLLVVVAGDERAGIDIVAPLTATHSVSGDVIGPDGPAMWTAVHLLPAGADTAPAFDVATAVSDGAGRFRFYGVPPGSYVARVVQLQWPTGEGSRLAQTGGTGAVADVSVLLGRRPDGRVPEPPAERVLYADVPVAVGSRDVDGVRVQLSEGPRLTGRADFAQTGTSRVPNPEDWQRVGVWLEAAGGEQHRVVYQGAFSDTGQFSTPSVWPGRYLVHVPVAPEGWHVKHVMHDGRDISVEAIELTEDVSDVVITFTDASSRVEGRVETDGSSSVPVTVLIFPTSRAGWLDYGSAARTVQQAAAALDGAFRFTEGPPPGEYFLVAIPEAQSTEWRNPAILERLAAVADRITVSENETVSHTLQVRQLR